MESIKSAVTVVVGLAVGFLIAWGLVQLVGVFFMFVNALGH